MYKVNLLLAAVIVALGTWAAILFKDFHAERERVLSLAARVAALERDLAAASDRETTLRAEVSDAAKSAAPAVMPAKATSPRPRTDAAASKPDGSGERERWLRRMADPKYRAAMMAQQRMHIERNYPDLAEGLNFPPELLDRFLDLLAAQQLAEMEHSFPGDEPRTPDEIGAHQQAIRERAAREETERAALLGDEAYAGWKEYLASRGARAQLRELRLQLAETSSPLRESQFEPLVKSLAAENQRHQAERAALYAANRDASPLQGQAYMDRRFALIEETIERQREAARSYLDIEQARRFDRMMDRELERARIELRSWHTMNKAELRDPG